MLKLSYKRKFLRFTETFSMDTAITFNKTDVQIDSWLLTPKSSIPNISNQKEPFKLQKIFKTLVIDLYKSEDEIFKDFQKNTRYKINRAIREGITFYVLRNPTDQQIEEFVEFFNEFAKTKKIMPCLPAKIRELNNKNALVITMAKLEGKILCCHGYIFEEQRTIMLYSASLRADKDSSEKNLIGRANRLLHWKSILSIKEMGCRWYDFCGLSQNPNDKEGQGINQFKKGFGGFEADEFKVYRGSSPLGKLVIIYSYLKWRKSPEYVTSNQAFKVKAAD